MARAKRRDPKSEALAQDGVLNPHPEAVRDALFAGNPFFDAKDLVQVRYEMVRRHQVDGVAISEAAASVRRHPANLLQGPERAADGWARRSAAEPARSQGRPQDLRRGRCLRGRSQSRKPRADDLAMSRRDRGTLRRQGAPAQPGAGAGAQKKTNQSSLIVASADAADTYEKLRAAVLHAEPTACPGLGILRRRGLAAWIRALGQESHAEAACGDHRSRALGHADPSPAASDITRLIAGIIVALAMEPVHA